MGKAHLCHVEVLHFESFLQLTVHPIPQLRIPHTHHDHRLHQVPHPRFPRLWPISQWPWCPGTRWWHCKKWVKLTNKQSVLRQETFKVCALVTSPFVRTSSSRIASWDFAELISTSKNEITAVQRLKTFVESNEISMILRSCSDGGTVFFAEAINFLELRG